MPDYPFRSRHFRCEETPVPQGWGPGQLLDRGPNGGRLSALAEEVEKFLVGGRQSSSRQGRFLAVGGRCQEQAQKNRERGHGSTPEKIDSAECSRFIDDILSNLGRDDAAFGGGDYCER
jgi:hypothetical protein